MFSNKENVNILTSILLQNNVQHAIVCPGSRNIPITNNLFEAGIHCYSVVDERSAGFYALGIALETRNAVAVVVTSGTALLNLYPAAAEAYYRNIPLIFISADRPICWINQFDGQTLPQQNVFKTLGINTYNLIEVKDKDDEWFCNRTANEALNMCCGENKKPIHINIPISEPLFSFINKELKTYRCVKNIDILNEEQPHYLAQKIAKAKRPLMLIGQQEKHSFDTICIEKLNNYIPIITEVLAYNGAGNTNFDDFVRIYGNEKEFFPDLIIFFEGNLVSKKTKQYLRNIPQCETILINKSGVLSDTFKNVSHIIKVKNHITFTQNLLNLLQETKLYAKTLNEKLSQLREKTNYFCPKHSQSLAVKQFKNAINSVKYNSAIHYSNSMAVRLACIYANHFVYCNRGANGIEGSVSTAAGQSLVTKDNVFCVVGDLSFFYDSNALWNNNIGGNLRILLLNNGGGGIFNTIEGLNCNETTHSFITASHSTNAKGLCIQNNIAYRCASNEQELTEGITWLTQQSSNIPMLLEVHTSSKQDETELKNYYKALK